MAAAVSVVVFDHADLQRNSSEFQSGDSGNEWIAIAWIELSSFFICFLVATSTIPMKWKIDIEKQKIIDGFIKWCVCVERHNRMHYCARERSLVNCRSSFSSENLNELRMNKQGFRMKCD